MTPPNDEKLANIILPLERLCRNEGNGGKCHAELVSASDGNNELRDPETSSG